MSPEVAAVVFGLGSALVWGAGDFCGGLASRRAPVLGVLAIAELSGLFFLLLFGILFREPVPNELGIAWGTAAGLSGTLGLGALYRGLAVGRAGIVAPVSAVVSVALPALYVAFTVGLPEPLQLLGFALAVAAIVLAAQSGRAEHGETGLLYGFVAGIGFGLFFICIDLAGGEGSTFFPLAIARGVSIPVVLLLLFVRREPLPQRNLIPLIFLSGTLDAGGNVLFLLSSTLGRLDIASVLSSLYPASTVILSRVVLHERISRIQQVGVALALLAIILIAF
jgi:drug/metabolite transporter (DMT)-like permease